MRVSSIDIGSNTVRLLVADVDIKGKTINFIFQDKKITRLGEGLKKTGFLKEEAIKRTAEAVCHFKKIADLYESNKVYAFATSAVREAKNKEDFVRKLYEFCGIVPDIIDGEKEALFTLLGVLWGLNGYADRLWIFDVGGGSTEYIFSVDSKPVFVKSLDLGVVKLTEEFLKKDPPDEGDIEKTINYIRSQLKVIPFNDLKADVLVATAGTATTIAAMLLKLDKYDPDVVHGTRVELGDVEELFKKLVKIRAQERLKFSGMEKGREDIIIAGMLITMETMRMLNVSSMIVSEWGVREGAIVYEVFGYKKLQGTYR